MISKKDIPVAIFFFLFPLCLMFGFGTVETLIELNEKKIIIATQENIIGDMNYQIAELTFNLEEKMNVYDSFVSERVKKNELQNKIQKLKYTLDQKQNKINELKEWNRILDLRNVKVSAYTPTVEECDDTPFINAAGKRVREGTIAVSPDLKEQGWEFGKRVYVKDVGIFVIEDVMNPRWKNKLDVFMFDRDKAIQFGLKNTKAVLLEKG